MMRKEVAKGSAFVGVHPSAAFIDVMRSSPQTSAMRQAKSTGTVFYVEYHCIILLSFSAINIWYSTAFHPLLSCHRWPLTSPPQDRRCPASDFSSGDLFRRSF